MLLAGCAAQEIPVSSVDQKESCHSIKEPSMFLGPAAPGLKQAGPPMQEISFVGWASPTISDCGGLCPPYEACFGTPPLRSCFPNLLQQGLTKLGRDEEAGFALRAVQKRTPSAMLTALGEHVLQARQLGSHAHEKPWAWHPTSFSTPAHVPLSGPLSRPSSGGEG